MNVPSRLTLASLVAIVLVLAAYLTVGLMKVDPLASSYIVHVEASTSGGLQPRADVTNRGVTIGTVQQIRLLPDHVTIDVLIRRSARIPADTRAVVADLSFAGEQYLDFRPTTANGPYLGAGSTVDRAHTTTPVPFADLIAAFTNLASQVDPNELRNTIQELDAAFAGSGQDLATIADGAAKLLTGLQQVLPNTTRLLQSSPIVLGTLVDLRTQLAQFVGSGHTIGTDLAASDPRIRQLLDSGPALLASIDTIIRANTPGMTGLITDLGVVGGVLGDKTSALSLYLQWLDIAATQLGRMVQDGQIKFLTDVFPRTSCDYNSPRRPPTEIHNDGPLLYRYCTTTGTDIQQRGSANAPRPPGDTTTGPPSGVTGLERATP